MQTSIASFFTRAGQASPSKKALVQAAGAATASGRKRKLSSNGDEREDKVAKLDEASNGGGEPQPGPSASGAERPVSSAFRPDEEDFDPVRSATWRLGESVPYLAVAQTFELVEATTKRLRIIDILANLYRSIIALTPRDLGACVYLCVNRIAPAFTGLELGVGDSLVMKAIAESTGRSMASIKEEAAREGDLGLVAEKSRGTQTTMFAPKPLSAEAVFKALLDMSKLSGNTVQTKKVGIIKRLLTACRSPETRFIVRAMTGKLRIGLAEQSVLVALARAVVLTPPSRTLPPPVLDASLGLPEGELAQRAQQAELAIKTAFSEMPSYDHLIPVLLEENGLALLPEKCHLQPGIPCKPMLAHPTKGIGEVLKRFEGSEFTCEWKYDGERAQIHVLPDGHVQVYSRNMEDHTGKYPDLVARIPRVLGAGTKTCILDCECVAWDVQKRAIQPFQILSTRKRKDAREGDLAVQVCLFAFDLLYLNGEVLVREPFRRRRELLRTRFVECDGQFMFAMAKDTTSTEEIESFLEESIKGNCEGLMVKTLDQEATYEIAHRSHKWLKIKKDYLDNIGDTLDLVVIGAYHGSGKRTGVYGGFLLACYDADNEEYQSICKIGTGFSDEDLRSLRDSMQPLIIPAARPYYQYDEGAQPDVWFDAQRVWEVKAADLSLSPVHRAGVGLVDARRGISLRFPRFIRVREDKGPEDATQSSNVAKMYNAQQVIANSNSVAPETDEWY